MESSGEYVDIPVEACSGIDCYCAWPPQGAYKYVTTHELGHLVQSKLAGNITSTKYAYACPENDPTMSALENDIDCSNWGTTAIIDGVLVLQDPPGMDDRCACNHIAYGNGLHCLQSMEATPPAQSEGYGQFFSTLMWNVQNSNCVFNYYKEILDDSCRSTNPDDCQNYLGSVSTMPPISLDCNQPVRWREQEQCGVTGELSEGGETATKATSGTEWDWMLFLRDVNRSITFNQLMGIYRHACHPENLPQNPPCLKAGEVDPSTGVTLVEDEETTGPTGCYEPQLTCDDTRAYSGVELQLKPDPLDPTKPLTAVVDYSVRGRAIYWSDDNNDTAVTKGGFYDGAVRLFGGELSAEVIAVGDLGNLHAVSDGSSP